MRATLLGVGFAAILAGVAHANAAEDGNAGLDALNGGDYQRAITLFTRALDSGQLSRDDQEFALANRGRAHAKAGEVSAAIADLDSARSLKPDDTDAQNDLVTLVAAKLPLEQVPGVSKARLFFGALGRAVIAGAAAGLQAGLAGDSQ